jgi:hypothetical protein
LLAVRVVALIQAASLALLVLLGAAPGCSTPAPTMPVQGDGELHAVAPDGTHVVVTFPDALDRTSAGEVARYGIDDFTGSGAGLAISAVAVDGAQVTLTTAMQQPGTTYTLSVNAVIDASGKSYTRTVNFVGVGAGPKAMVTFRVDDTFEQTLTGVKLVVTFDPSTGYFTHFNEEVTLTDDDGDHVWEGTFEVAVDPMRTTDTSDDRLSPGRVAYAARAVDDNDAPLSELVFFEVKSTDAETVDIALSSRPPPPPPEGLVDVTITVDDTRAHALTTAVLAASIKSDGTFDSSFPTMLPLNADADHPGIYTATTRVRLDPSRMIGSTDPDTAPYVFYVVNDGKPYPNLSAAVDATDETARMATINVGNPDLIPVTFRVDVSGAYLSADGSLRGVAPGEAVYLTGQFNVAETAFGENASDAFTGGESTALEMEPLRGVPGVWTRTIFLGPSRAYGWKAVRCPKGMGCGQLNQLVVSSGRAFATVMKNLATENKDAGSNPEVVLVDPRQPAESAVMTPVGTLDYSHAQVYIGMGMGREPDPANTPNPQTLFKQEIPDLVVEVGTDPVTTPVYIVGTWRDVNLPETPSQLLSRCGGSGGGGSTCQPLDLNPYDYDDGFAGRTPPTYDLRPPSRFDSTDGVLDAGTTLVAGTDGMTLTIRLAYDSDAQTLYIATQDAGEGSDHFVFVSATAPGALVPAQWGKAGMVASSADMLFMVDENDGPYCGWYRRAGSAAEMEIATATGGDPAFHVGTPAMNGGVLEGTIDLSAAFGGQVPSMLYLAVAPFGTSDAGPMYPMAQAPTGNGDGNLDATEFVKVSIPDLMVVP